MENISKKEINYRIDNIKTKVKKINENIKNNNEDLKNKYDFAKTIGVKIEKLELNDEVIEALDKYIVKADEIIKTLEASDEESLAQEYKLLNSILYLDDIKLKNITELVKDNNELNMKNYINDIANKANELIRQEELKKLDENIASISKKSNIFERIIGRDKLKKALLENYNLKRVEAINKNYIPRNKSIFEIVSIMKNCGYESQEIDCFMQNLISQYNIESPEQTALVDTNTITKIPLFPNKEYINKLNAENTIMLDRINYNKKNPKKQEGSNDTYIDLLKQDVKALELSNYNYILDEVKL